MTEFECRERVYYIRVFLGMKISHFKGMKKLYWRGFGLNKTKNTQNDYFQHIYYNRIYNISYNSINPLILQKNVYIHQEDFYIYTIIYQERNGGGPYSR